MSKRAVSSIKATSYTPVIVTVDPTECPFREFRDNELQPEYWGMGPASFRAHSTLSKQSGSSKPPPDQIWIDDQAQPLPRSVRRYLDGWIRAEELAESRWESEVVIFEEESNGGRMLIQDTQLSHAQVLLRSAFCREVLSACFMLEKTEFVTVEHQWENFTCNFGPEGWRAKYHIYSPGLKPGGGVQHRPVLSKNGCYLVRLYYLGAWRCVWVSDQVPVDATGAPLLPFSPLLSKAPASKPGVKQAPPTVTAQVVYLWPLLLCKALLKLAAPDMNSDEFAETLDDESMPEFNILHALTGGLNMSYIIKDEQKMWDLITAEVPVFSWDDDEDTHTSTVKSKSTKKPIGKETITTKSRGSLVYAVIQETKDYAPYYLPGITPGCEMSLLITMARDLPLKKPLPEPEVALWKHHRWVDWARSHGLYEAYDCPRTKFLKANGLMKLSYAPHLLDVQSTESISMGIIRVEHSKTNAPVKGRSKDAKLAPFTNSNQPQIKEELREWLKYDAIFELVESTHMLFFPSLYEITSGASCPPIRITKVPYNKALDIQASKSSPFYLQIDGPETNLLRVSLSMLHPRILANSGVLIEEYVESAHLVLEKFEWFEDCFLPKPKAFVKTCGYNTVEAKFVPGRHFCRIWVHSRMNWHLTLLSESRLLLGPRDQIQCAAVRECPWVSRFLLALGASFANWLRINRSNHYLPSVKLADQEFFRHYHPDLPWDNEVVGYDRSFLHWMFRQALQVHLNKRLPPADRTNVFIVLRKYFCDPNLGLPLNTLPTISLKEIADLDPCDCLLPEIYEAEMLEEHEEEIVEQEAQEEIHLVNPEVMAKLLEPPKPPIASNICEFATEELPCGILKEERGKVIKKHEAATIIQAHWRGAWARKCLKTHVTVTPEVLKALQDSVYGNQESLMSLMNEFFRMYPGTKHAYSVSSALSGVYGLHQYNGTSPVTPRCKWIPYFQGVFFCHASVKVHFDVTSSLHHSTIAVYNNDTGAILPQVFNAHKTFDFKPNMHGYTVMGHGSLNETSAINFDVHWQLTVLSSIEGVFHVCDNEDSCKEINLPPANKIHIDEIFLPNRRNILGGIHLSVTKHEAVSFRAAVTSPDLKIEATLRTLSPSGLLEEISKCSGTGEIFWPYIRLEPPPISNMSQIAFTSTPVISFSSVRSGPKSLKKPQSGRSQKSATKIRPVADPKYYSIEVTAPSGWPLTLSQWRRVDEVRNSTEILRAEGAARKPPAVKGIIKPSSVRDKPTDKRLSFTQTVQTPQPQSGDAYVELECSLAVGGGINARRDDERDLIFAAARRSWNENEPGRNQRGAEIRKLFREENLLAPPPPESSHSTTADFATLYEGGEGEEHNMADYLKKEEPPGPTPATESGMLEMSVEDEEEIKYFEMPEQLKDKFVPLDFTAFCTKEMGEDSCIVISWSMAEAAKKERQARIQAALERMRELQTFNEVHMLGRQKTRTQMLDKLNVEARWCVELLQALEDRDEAIAQETLLRVNSANRKKQLQKNEATTKQQPKSKK